MIGGIDEIAVSGRADLPDLREGHAVARRQHEEQIVGLSVRDVPAVVEGQRGRRRSAEVDGLRKQIGNADFGVIIAEPDLEIRRVGNCRIVRERKFAAGCGVVVAGLNPLAVVCVSELVRTTNALLLRVSTGATLSLVPVILIVIVEVASLAAPTPFATV